jgi:hypothetical protein
MNRKHLTRALVALFAVVAAPAVWAHGGQEHVMGTVSSASATELVVKTTAGGERTVQLTADTKVEKDGEPSTAADLQPGQRVVVHTRKQGDALTAVLIKTGLSAKDKGNKGTHHQHGSREGHESPAAGGK